MSHQRKSALTAGPARAPRGVRWLAVLGVGTLAAGLVLAVAAPAQAIEGGDGGGKTCANTGPETTGTSATTTSSTTTSSTTTSSSDAEQTTETTTDDTSSATSTVQEFRMAPKSLSKAGDVNVPANCIAALVQWVNSAGGYAQVWFTKLESEVTSGHVGIEAGDSETLATLLLDSDGGANAFDGVQIHQSLSPAGNYQQPTAVIDGGDDGNLHLTGPECSDTECVWTVEYNPPALRASGHALRAVVGPPGGPVVTITNVGLSRGGGAQVPTTTPTSTSSTTTVTPTTSPPAITTPPEVVVLGESQSVSPAPAETVTVAGLAETGVAVDRYVSVAVLLMLLGTAMLVFAAGGLRRRERR